MWIGRSHGGTPAMSRPSRKMRPAVGSSNPASIRNKVVLPQPDPPSSEKISPLPTVRVTLSTALKVPKLFDTPSIRRKGSSTPAAPAQPPVLISVQARFMSDSCSGVCGSGVYIRALASALG